MNYETAKAICEGGQYMDSGQVAQLVATIAPSLLTKGALMTDEGLRLYQEACNVLRNYDIKPEQVNAVPKKDTNYVSLETVFKEAVNQAQYGKGKERHANDEPFEEQKICSITRQVGLGYPKGQAIKKIIESERLDKKAAIAELYGALNYIAASIIVLNEK